MPKQSLPDLFRRSLVLSVPGVAVFAGVGVALDKVMMPSPARYIQQWIAALYEELSREKGEPKFPTPASPGAFNDTVKFDDARKIQAKLFQEFHDHLQSLDTGNQTRVPKADEIRKIIDALSGESAVPEYAIDQALDLMTDVYVKFRPPAGFVKFRPVFLTAPQEPAIVAELREKADEALSALDKKRRELRTACPSQISTSEQVKNALILLTNMCSQSRDIYIK